MSRSAWAKFATYISFHGGLFLGPMNDGAPFVEMFRLLISEEECELGVHIPNKPTSVEKIAADAKVPVDRAAAMLKHMSQKGACFERVTADGKCFYNITPFIPGFYEIFFAEWIQSNDSFWICIPLHPLRAIVNRIENAPSC